MSIAFPKLDPDWLRAFLAVAEYGGVQAAARVLRLSQPALSTRIRRLEETLGNAVFDRSAQGMALTEAGRRLLPVARRLAAVMQEALEAVDPGAVDRARLSLRLGASTSLANFVLPSLIGEFAKERRLEGLDLRVGNTDEVLSWVRGGRVALGAVEGLKRAAGLHLEPFAQDEIVPVYAPDAVEKDLGLAIEKATRAGEIARLPILWRELGSGTRRVIEGRFKELGVSELSVNTEYTLGGTIALRGAALAGLGIAFLPRRAVGQELTLGSLREIGLRDLHIERTFSWVLPAGNLPQDLERFRRWIDAHFRSEGTKKRRPA